MFKPYVISIVKEARQVIAGKNSDNQDSVGTRQENKVRNQLTVRGHTKTAYRGFSLHVSASNTHKKHTIPTPGIVALPT